MSAYEIISTYWPAGGASLLIVLLALIKIKPLEISIWSWLFRKIGRAFNGDMLDRISEVEKKLDDHISSNEEEKILQIRQRILRFADEMFCGIYHSKAHFEEILRQCREYELYCDLNPEFENGKTGPAIELIRNQYMECLEKHSFEIKKGEKDEHSNDGGRVYRPDDQAGEPQTI